MLTVAFTHSKVGSSSTWCRRSDACFSKCASERTIRTTSTASSASCAPSTWTWNACRARSRRAIPAQASRWWWKSPHVWGRSRHYIGSNFFWYLRDPAGNFTEYYSDMDCIIDDQLWKPEVFDQGPKSLFSWGPPPPPSFIMPEDLAAHMVGAHSGR